MPHRIVNVDAGEGTRLDTVDSVATVKVGAADTADTYELFEIDSPGGGGVPPHRHPWPEAYYVLEGTLGVQIGGRSLTLHPGDTVTIPPNAVHATEVPEGSCRFLAFSLTGGTGALFADLDRSVPKDRPMEEVVPVLLAVAERRGVTFVKP